MSAPALDEFLTWCRQKEINFEGLEVRSAGEGAGNGVFATRFFRCEEKFISLPEDLMITAGKVADMDRYAEIIDRSKVLLTPFEILTLFFCLEDADSNESEYGPYLRLLPKSFDTPAYQGISIDPLDLPLSVRDFWVTQIKDLSEIYAKIHCLDASISRQKFLWAWHVVNTRCIFVENKPNPRVDSSEGDNLAVIPFVDMLNHSTTAQGFAMLDRYSHSYVVKASHRCVSEGDQVFVCYGPHDNPRLWIEYGFTMDQNPNTKVVITHELFLALAKRVGIEVTPEHESAIGEANLPCSCWQSDDGPSWALRANMRILLMTPQEITSWRDVIYAEKKREESSSEDDSDDDSEGAPKRPRLTVAQRREMTMLRKVFVELRTGIEGKAQKVAKNLKWMWEDQLRLIDATIASIIL